MPVRKYCSARRRHLPTIRSVDDSLLTELSNVVAYACRSSSRKDRHDVHQNRRRDRPGAINGGRRYDAHGLASARPRPPNERRKGRKGRKPRILRKYGPRRRCRDAAETGGNWRKLAETFRSCAVSPKGCSPIRLRKLRKLVSAGSGPVTAPRYGRSSGTPLTWRAPRGPARRTARAASETRMAQGCSLASLRLHVWNWSISE
jgi:hypothetical protein